MTCGLRSTTLARPRERKHLSGSQPAGVDFCGAAQVIPVSSTITCGLRERERGLINMQRIFNAILITVAIAGLSHGATTTNPAAATSKRGAASKPAPATKPAVSL